MPRIEIGALSPRSRPFCSTGLRVITPHLLPEPLNLTIDIAAGSRCHSPVFEVVFGPTLPTIVCLPPRAVVQAANRVCRDMRIWKQCAIADQRPLHTVGGLPAGLVTVAQTQLSRGRVQVVVVVSRGVEIRQYAPEATPRGGPLSESRSNSNAQTEKHRNGHCIDFHPKDLCPVPAPTTFSFESYPPLPARGSWLDHTPLVGALHPTSKFRSGEAWGVEKTARISTERQRRPWRTPNVSPEGPPCPGPRRGPRRPRAG